jgi:NAD(P)-dependent dehydrogenase (short-subunit alcohol dehydrogenase family)
MGPYTSTKAGVEALTDALRMETAPTGARIGCAYFGFIDTDMVRGSFSQPSTQALNKRLPSFMRNPIPLPQAIDAIEHGIERRASRLWAPHWIGPMLALRGIVQPLTERRMLGEPDLMTEAIHIAASSHETDTQDPLLGVAMQAADAEL